MMRWLVACALAVCCASTTTQAYLKLGTVVNGKVVDTTWAAPGPIPYFISDKDGGGLTAADLRGAAERATGRWQAVPTARVRFAYQGFTSASPDMGDGRTTLGFVDRPDLDRVLGATSFIVDTVTGNIVEADILFNSRFPFSVAANGEAGRVDLESVVVHELGHLIGLGHSAIGETELSGGGRRVTGTGSVMFPIALTAGAVADRLLQPDDVAGVSDLYPTDAARTESGGIVGRVTRNGQGIKGAHVIAFNPETGILVGNFSLDATGDFVVARLPPGPYILRVEPIDDAEPDSFFPSPIDTNFQVTYAPRMVVAPRGGSSNLIEIKVPPK
jgi:hypothetical protein